MPLLLPLTQDEQSHFLAVALDDDTLRQLAGSLGTAPKGYRIDKLSVWQMADSLVDYYNDDAEVSGAVDHALTRVLGTPPLAAALATIESADAVTALLLQSKDPVRDLAWSLLHAEAPDAAERASALAKLIIEDFDEADRRAQEVDAAPRPASPEVQVKRAVRDAAKEAQKALTARERAEQRLDHLKQQLADLEERLATARREQRETEKARRQSVVERDRLQKERDGLRAKLQSGTAGEAERLRAALEDADRRERGLAGSLDDARGTAASLTARVRELEQRSAAPVAVPVVEADTEPSAAPPNWSMPIFSGEFYDSLKRWDRRLVRATFDKIHRLCEDWRHPSLRAIPLEGLPDCYRIRIATDVRLIYKPLDGGRLEIRSLIDREDLQRYVRNAKG